jgi:hypothetical protein
MYSSVAVIFQSKGTTQSRPGGCASMGQPQRIAAWLLFSISIFGVMLLEVVVPNVGVLYRFRYAF